MVPNLNDHGTTGDEDQILEIDEYTQNNKGKQQQKQKLSKLNYVSTKNSIKPPRGSNTQ